ncbi:hypothetical protein [Microbacterium aurantiacum]|uniref:hypothetical protein n=1 Tax=Microbacterium aurantiacum TaxID=162393 RepID=UPI003F4939B5
MRAVRALCLTALADPAITRESVKGGTRCLTPDASEKRKPAYVCLDNRCDGLERQEAQSIENPAVGRPAARDPSATGGPRTVLNGANLTGDPIGA